MRHLVRTALAVLFLAPSAVAQPNPPVHVPPIEITTGVSFEHSSPGAVASISGNLSNILAMTSELATSEDGIALLGGARIGTGFWYDGRPPMPGRFFAQIMVGRQRGPVQTAGTIVQPGVGADVIVVPRLGVGLHWSLDYKHIVGAPPDRSGARFLVGVLIGPHT